MLETPPVVLPLVSEALDDDIFLVTTAKVKDADLAHRHIRVLQSGGPQPLLANHLVSRSDALVTAFVERDADVEAAAEAIVLARFGLRGASGYAPDIVLVNEWVKEKFLVAVMQRCVGVGVVTQGATGLGRPRPDKTVELELLDEVAKEGFTDVLSTGKDGVVLDVKNR